MTSRERVEKFGLYRARFFVALRNMENVTKQVYPVGHTVSYVVDGRTISAVVEGYAESTALNVRYPTGRLGRVGASRVIDVAPPKLKFGG